jgi:hypothetical protein
VTALGPAIFLGGVVLRTLIVVAAWQPTPSPAPRDAVDFSWTSLAFTGVMLAVVLFLMVRYLKLVLGRP